MPHHHVITPASVGMHDLSVLGRGFARHFRVDRDDAFADLLGRLDCIKSSPFKKPAAQF